jgi:hypothetical protein
VRLGVVLDGDDDRFRKGVVERCGKQSLKLALTRVASIAEAACVA